MIASGGYYLSSMAEYTNAPANVGYGFLLVIGEYTGTRFMQILFHGYGQIYTRIKRDAFTVWTTNN